MLGPGLTRTSSLRQNTEEGAVRVGQAILTHHLTHRLGEPLDIANMCLFLATDESSHITGQAFSVDGGVTM